MKLSVSTYSYSRLIQAGAMTLPDAIAKTKELGFDGVEILDLKRSKGEPVEDMAKRVREKAEAVGLPIVNYTVGADLLNGSGGDLQAEIAAVCHEVDIACLLGAKSIRHDATTGYSLSERGQRGFEDALPRLIEGCRAITAYAKEKGVRTMIENHGTFCQESMRVEKIVNGVGDENFGLLADMGNFLCADEAPEQAFGRVAPYAFYVHAKDFYVRSGLLPDPGRGFFKTRGGNYLKGTIVGHGDVPVAQCLAILKANGYNGYLGIEFEGMENPLDAIAIGRENLLRYLGK